MEGTGIRELVGNHGAEPWEGGAKARRQTSQWARALCRELTGIPGLRIENKIFSLTVHYRQCKAKREIHDRILRAARDLPHARIVGGKQAISLVSWDAPNKGYALTARLDRLGCRAVFVGDDATDEDVFALRDDRILTVRVGRRKASQAQYFLKTQQEIDDLLRFIDRL